MAETDPVGLVVDLLRKGHAIFFPSHTSEITIAHIRIAGVQFNHWMYIERSDTNDLLAISRLRDWLASQCDYVSVVEIYNSHFVDPDQ